MRFGKTLKQSVYAPWKDKYIDYGKLKSMLRENEDDEVPWTEEDENRFCDEIFNMQLEKVAQFQEETVAGLRERVDAAFEKLRDLAPPATGEESATGTAGVAAAAAVTATADRPKGDITIQRLRELETQLDGITNEVKELKKYSNLNYTGFLKIVKKHDRKRGDRYKIRPMMQLSLAKRPFNSEQGYAPLLNKLSLLYFAVRQQLEDGNGSADAHPIDLESPSELHNGEKYTAHKFWVHPDNLLEVKTYILRRLPALIYSQSSNKEVDSAEDPTLTSLYFDNNNFDLYSRKVAREAEAASLRLRWYGQLSAKPDIFLERKVIHENGSSEETKFIIKEKYVKPFLDGEYKMEKTIQKMKRQSQVSPEEIETLKATVDNIQGFVEQSKLQPVLRANYVRTAFQKPADDRVRISIDTEIAFIREDTLDRDRPCRDPQEWHRTDIDNSNMTYPFKNINQSEVSRFPFAVLEIKLKEETNRKRPTWVEDLMSSYLVHPAPRFSKFVHGVASLFEDYVNRLPFWLSELETDIRKDPRVAFEEEEQKRALRAEDEQVVGSLLGAKVGSFKPSRSSPVSKSYLAERAAKDLRAVASPTPGDEDHRRAVGEVRDEAGGPSEAQPPQSGYGTLSSVFPGFSLSRYSKARRAREQAVQQLPEGVVEPTEWIKNTGPLQIEPKVWLANERTFLKWQHICVLLGGLAIGLYTAAGQNLLAAGMGVGYIVIAAFAGLWGYYMHHERRAMIMARSGRDFDNMFGPMVISIALMLALILNFVFAYRAAFSKLGDDEPAANSTMGFVGELI